MTGAKSEKRRTYLTSFVKMDSDEPFDTFKAQALVKISDKLKPDLLSYDNYDVAFAIKRHYPQKYNLNSDEDYGVSSSVLPSTRTPIITITIIEKERNGNGGSDDEVELVMI